jgi:hypothetical protein
MNTLCARDTEARRQRGGEGLGRADLDQDTVAADAELVEHLLGEAEDLGGSRRRLGMSGQLAGLRPLGQRGPHEAERRNRSRGAYAGTADQHAVADKVGLLACNTLAALPIPSLEQWAYSPKSYALLTVARQLVICTRFPVISR